MTRGLPSRSRLLAWSVLLFGVVVAGCKPDPVTPPPPPPAQAVPDADRSSVTVSKALDVLANGTEAVDIQVTVRAADGSPLAGHTVRVTASGEGNTVTQPAAPTGDSGEAGARLASTVAGTKTVTVSVEAEGGPVTLTQQPTVTFVSPVSPSASRLVFTAAPTVGRAGEALGAFEVTFQDAEGRTVTDARGSVSVKLGAGLDGTLQGERSVAAVNGVARFTTLRIDRAAQGYTLVASAEGLPDATSATFEVKPAAAASLTLTPARTSWSASVAESFTVAVRDAFDNVVVDYTGSVRFESSDTSAVLPARYTFTATDAGRHVFTATLNQVGSRQLTVTDTANAALTRTVTITVVAYMDTTPPATPTLSIASRTSTQMELTWTAVGDDGNTGTATHHEVRYSTSPITPASFASATLVTEGDPQAPGTPESVFALGLNPDTLYYFALQVSDEAGNTSFATTSGATNTNPCLGYTCTPAAPSCAADGVSRITYTATCVDVDNKATCEQAPSAPTACTGANAVCFQGACDTATRPAANQVVLSEVMHTPSAGTTEYVELTNTSSALVNLNGLTVSYLNAAGSETVFTLGTGTTPLVVGRKGTFVMASNANASTNGGVSANVAYPSGLVLDGTGQLNLLDGETLVTGLEYTAAFPHTSGKAMSLSSRVLGSFASDKSWYWCDAETALTGGDYGTPNAANPDCGIPATPTLDFCAIQSPKTLPTTPVGTTATVSGRFHGTGVTDRNPNGNDFYPYVFAELGYGPAAASAVDWTWSPVLFSGEYAPVPSSGDDEVLGALAFTTAGDYRYGFRFSFEQPGSPRTGYVYCGQNGIADPATGLFGTVTVGSPPVMTDHVVISEVAVAGTTGANDEFVELYNPTNAEVDISGWRIQYMSAAGTTYSNTYQLPTGSKIGPRKYFLAASKSYMGSVSPDAKSSSDFALGGTNGHVRIGRSAIGAEPTDPLAVDTLGYGSAGTPEKGKPAYGGGFPAGGSAERKAYSTSTSESMGPGGADATHGNGYDSDNNSVDFVPRATREPQNAASPAELP